MVNLVLVAMATTCAAVLLALAVEYLYKRWCLRTLMVEIEAWLSGYRVRLTDQNRFIINLTLLCESFPEYSRDLLTDAWIEMIKRGYVQEDPLDKQWIVRL